MSAAREVSDAFRHSMRHVASTVCIVSASGPAGRVGVTATSVCPVSMSPPLVLACINVGSLSHDPLLEAGHFALNVLDESQQAVADVFAGRAGLGGEARFQVDADAWESGAARVPVLRGAVTSLACRLVQRVPAGTHSILIGEVLDVRRSPAGNPLLYLEGRYRSLAADTRCTEA